MRVRERVRLHTPVHTQSACLCARARDVQKGKNPSRVLSMTRMKQARISSMFYCRLVPGDIIELLFDHVARFAFRVRCALV